MCIEKQKFADVGCWMLISGCIKNGKPDWKEAFLSWESGPRGSAF